MISDNDPSESTDDGLSADEHLEDASQDTATDAGEPTRSGPPAIPERYAALELELSAVIIYDREHTTAWIQSNRAIPLKFEGVN